MAGAFILLQILSCAILAFTFNVRGKIVWNDVCPNATTLGNGKATIDNSILSGSIKRDGTFVIPGVPDGTHILSIISHDYAFDQLRIDVNDSLSSVEVRPFVPGTPMQPPSSILLPYPAVLTPRDRYVYFVPPESFNLAGMLSNPMMLLMVGGAGMMLAMPYLIKNMDPEALEEFKEQQAKLGGIQNAFQSGEIKSGINAIMAATEEQSSSSSAQPNKGGAGSRGRGNKKSKR
ncbi:hypothetical protein HYPSUDRAFT_355403 [Hypholoma sublateritium FD-334 SS-4]|uniref:ER membrane protein complex subunit 7 beta-sandwich domain-containing protein n=1 Tax=Hypholoma sublateritium (strain FD-334 SS-4) TaxID=945553 RepID=A0A0D2P5H8_HYPSF|nr:hypothetical protein HYPSUDRAFT_355403 [Hypholoma sublateritium FD-334 SS-4]